MLYMGEVVRDIEEGWVGKGLTEGTTEDRGKGIV